MQQRNAYSVTKGAGADMRAYSTKRLNLTGQRFGMLTVLRRVENIGRDTAWLCRCDCGSELVVRTSYLRRGTTHSCGCDFREDKLEGTTRLDLTGQRFGKLTALKPLGKSGRAYKWLCRCDCGNECAVAVSNLRNGHTGSCGCEIKPPPVHNVDGTCVELLRSGTVRRNNSSGVTGVTWRKKDSRWAADICFKGKRYFLGLYDRFDDAVQARRNAEAEHFGTFLADYEAGRYDERSAMTEPA